MSNILIETRELDKYFGERKVLENINMTLKKGQIKVIIGPSGSGKSTLLRCINFLEMPTRGQIFMQNELIGLRKVNGRFIQPSTKELQKYRRKIGIVFQKFNLWPHMTVLENIIEGPVHVKGVDKHTAKEEAMELLEKVRLPDRANAYPATLSGGQQQRVAIARALAMKPELLLLDEVTSALDPELKVEVLDTLSALAAEGTTMLLVTHEMGFARDVADEVVFIDNASIVETGSPSEVLENPTQPETRRFMASLRRLGLSF